MLTNTLFIMVNNFNWPKGLPVRALFQYIVTDSNLDGLTSRISSFTLKIFVCLFVLSIFRVEGKATIESDISQYIKGTN